MRTAHGPARSIAVVAGALVLAGCAAPAPTPARTVAATQDTTLPSPTAPNPSVDPAVVIGGPWSPMPVDVGSDARAAIGDACRAEPSSVYSFGLADQQVVLADARGLGVVPAILADDFAAFLCVTELASGGGVSVIGPPARLDVDPIGYLEAGQLVIVHQAPDESSGAVRTVMVGRVGPRATRVRISVRGSPDITAAVSGGWFAAWWPSADAASAVTATDASTELDSVASPELVEGRMTPATWWVDPAALPLDPGVSTIPALVMEKGCAGGRSPEGRLKAPLVFAGTETVLVAIWVRVRGGAQDCPGNPSFATTVDLREPLGGRRLLDAGETPPRDATAPPP